MPDDKIDQTPFDELVSDRETPGDAPPGDSPSAPPPQSPGQSTASPHGRTPNPLKSANRFLNSVRWPSPDRLPTGTLVGLSMVTGALVVFFLSVVLHYVLPRPQSRFNAPVPVAVKSRPPAQALVEITPGTTATGAPAVNVIQNAPADAPGAETPGAADVIKDPQAFEFDQKLAEQRRLENEKLAEARKAEDAKTIEARKLEDQKLLEQQRLDEDQRLAAERKLEDEKLAAERKLEDDRVAAARQRAEARKLEADTKLAEARKAEDQRRADLRKLEDEKMLQQRQTEDQQRQPSSKL